MALGLTKQDLEDVKKFVFLAVANKLRIADAEFLPSVQLLDLIRESDHELAEHMPFMFGSTKLIKSAR